MHGKKIALAGIALLFSLSLFCQNGGSIQGTVVDKSSRLPVEFATIQLLKVADSSVINTTLTDKKGKFLLQHIPNGNYLVQKSFIGYIDNYTPVAIDKEQKINLGIIELLNTAKNMNEVVVTSQKSVLNTSIDRKVYNVSRDIMAQSGTASDILKNIPSVEVDIDGNVSLRGSGEVMILINGRPSP